MLTENQRMLILIGFLLILASVNIMPRMLPQRVVLETSSPDITVSVAGAVQEPGVYVLPWGARVEDVIALAGGLRYDAEVSLVRSAELLDAGSTVFVPFDTGEQGESLISLNGASPTELQSLPGIGPSIAEKIARNRPYNSLEDLMRVPGIGDKTLARLRPFITL